MGLILYPQHLVIRHHSPIPKPNANGVRDWDRLSTVVFRSPDGAGPTLRKGETKGDSEISTAVLPAPPTKLLHELRRYIDPLVRIL